MKNRSIIILLAVAFYTSSCSCKRTSEDPAPVQQRVAGVFADSDENDFYYNRITVRDMRNPRGIAKDGLGNFYISDLYQGRIIKIATDSAVTDLGYATDPQAIAADAAGNIYIASPSANIIYKMTPDGSLTILAGSGTAGFVNGTGTAASFNKPSGVAVDVDGNIFVTDFNNSAIRKITPVGVVSTYLCAADQEESEELLVVPYGITADTTGVLYITDNDRVLKITPGRTVSKTYKEIQSGVSPFTAPVAVAVDAAGNLFVTDIYNWVIYKIDTQGNSSIYYGNIRTEDQQQVVITLLRESYGILVSGEYVFASSADLNLIFRVK